MTLKVVAWDIENQRPKLTDKDPSLIVSAAGTRADSVELLQNSTSKVFTFSQVMPTANYSVTADFYNAVDTTPLYQQVIITDKTVNGFTAQWNFPLDTNNYELSYTASEYGYSAISGSDLLTIGSTSKMVVFSPALASTSFVISVDLLNSVDSMPSYQPLVVTGKTTGSFTVKWNIPLETSNYFLEWHLNLIT